MGKQSYAFPVEDVVSIEEMKEISNVPMSGEYVTGMVVIRDEVLQVYDLEKRLAIPDFLECKDVKYGNSLLVVETGDKRMVMEITLAKDIIEVDGELEGVPASLSIPGNFIKGIIKKDNDLVPVIDIKKMINAYKAVA